jgi:dimeric dUTPase (all-alpha-NTP-PPase superfamily)
MTETRRGNTIELTCPQMGTTDYLTFDETTTFNDIINQLKQKYANEILTSVTENFQNIRKDLSLNEVTMKLHYIDKNGTRQTVGLYTKVGELKKKQRFHKIYWEAEPIGGLGNF